MYSAMISVMISVNGNPIMGRSAVRKKDRLGPEGNISEYHVDDGTKILHNPDDGALVLAKKLLGTIKEVKE